MAMFNTNLHLTCEIKYLSIELHRNQINLPSFQFPNTKPAEDNNGTNSKTAELR